MRQVELAKILGITQAQLSKYERGQNALSIELLLKLKHFSGKSSDWILTGEVSARRAEIRWCLFDKTTPRDRSEMVPSHLSTKR